VTPTTFPFIRSRRSALAVIAGLVTASGALASPGDILWSIERDGYGGFSCRPAVAPDGSLYWTFRGLYRLNPANGEVVWFRADHSSPLIAIGPDGTIYGTGSVNMGTPEEPFWHPTALALTPNNEVLWSWPYDASYWYPEAGPTLGPDGNLYIISYGGYWRPGHLFSLTTGGAFRWERRDFADGSGVQHLTFSGGNVMKVGDSIGIPGGPLVTFGSGMIASDMQTGQVAWTEQFADAGDPVVSPIDGAYYVKPGLSQIVMAYASPHQHTWYYEAPWSPTGTNTVQVGPDGNVYVSEGIFRVHSLSPDGQMRWSNNAALPASYYYIPSVSPDGSVIIYPTTGPGETPGYVTALRTSDGAKLWEMNLGKIGERVPTRCTGGITFSRDGRVAYVPATSICYCGPSGYEEHGHLFAIEVQPGGPACYANCDGSAAAPVLNVGDFTCFLQKFAGGDAYANCDGSVAAPVLNVQDFTCFLQKFAAGCQ
jgi:hypothetical protein